MLLISQQYQYSSDFDVTDSIALQYCSDFLSCTEVSVCNNNAGITDLRDFADFRDYWYVESHSTIGVY